MNYSPRDVALNYHHTAVHKAETPALVLFFRAVLAGALIALAAFGANSIYALIENQAVAKLLAAMIFPAGLAMILLCGGELFTSACLMLLALGKGSVSVRAMLKSWGIIFLGNYAGTAIVALLTAYARPMDAAFIQATLHTAEVKYHLTWMSAFARGILCNLLVCTAVWMSYGTSSNAGKLAALYFPIMLFVLTSTEHSVTNMYYFTAAFVVGAVEGMTFSGFLLNHLLPVTLGNIVGGSVLFGGLIWFSFLAGKNTPPTHD